MSSLDDIRENRLSKLKKLQDSGINPFPVKSKQDLENAEVIKNFSKFLRGKKKEISLVGRIMSLRPQGAIIFFNFSDGTGVFQALLKKAPATFVKQNLKGQGTLSIDDFKLFEDTADIGDFVEIRGKLFLTKRKEKTIEVHHWRMLSKGLRPLPEKWHGLQDVEERFRKRYLDTLMNDEVKEKFLLRTRMINEIKNFYNSQGFVEVEVPMLQPLAGGANARPFITHHNALDMDFYLPTAQELYLKELLVGGFTKVYEIGRRFRNEGIDHTHNPEFTMLESNIAYGDAQKDRKFIEDLFKYVVKKLFNKTKVEYDGQLIDFGKKFAVIKFLDTLKRYALISEPESISRNDAALKAKQLGVKVEEHESLEKILDNIFKKVARPKLTQPTFIVDHPVAMNPFAKRKEDNSNLIDRFQLIVGGIELVNAFSETNNPIEQRQRYLEEDKRGKAGEGDISPSDEAYIEAMEYGMPPNSGIGIGIDRLAMLLTDTKNIKEVILFPTLRPKD